MASLTIRNLPEDLVARLKRAAAKGKRSMEQELRELLLERYATRDEIIGRVKAKWERFGESSAKEVDTWIDNSRDSRP